MIEEFFYQSSLTAHGGRFKWLNHILFKKFLLQIS